MAFLLDESIGNVTETLRETGMLENTVIIFSTDNGGPPHGMSFNHANNWPLRFVISKLLGKYFNLDYAYGGSHPQINS